jgi:aspartate-semialdehyde dehydrogenase
MSAGHVAIIGATGIVGEEILRVLEERDFPLDQLTMLASRRSAGTRVEFRHQNYIVRPLTQDALRGVQLALFAADAETSTAYAPHVVRSGAVVIDCSSAFRLDPGVPLCVPEVNAEVLLQHQGIVAVPHSLTTQLSLAMAPLHAAATLKRVVVSTYQAVSGAGRQAVQEFDQQLRDLLNFRPAQAELLPHQIAFNCLPQCGDFLDNAYTQEEMALIEETRKLLQVPELPMTATAAYVPLAHSHSAAVTLEMAQPLSVDAARELLEQAPGIVVEDDRARQHYPQPIRASGQDEVFVGRLRADPSVPYGLHLWIVADNLRKGAALNVVQIAELLMAAR